MEDGAMDVKEHSITKVRRWREGNPSSSVRELTPHSFQVPLPLFYITHLEVTITSTGRPSAARWRPSA